MSKAITSIKTVAAILIVATAITFTACTNNGSDSAGKSEIDSLKNQIAQLTSGNEGIANNLVKFDTLDFTVFSNQE